MIGYLQGELLSCNSLDRTKKNLPTRSLILNVQGVGYEVVVAHKTALKVGNVGDAVGLFIHTQLREDSLVLYGFASLPERDIFRQLVSVSGIGSQVAMALLDTLGLPDLVRAIVTGNGRLLCMAQGVGSKTAERLCLELKAKLSEWRTGQTEGILPSSAVPLSIQEDVELTLLALGYGQNEINQAIANVSIPPPQRQDVEIWIKNTIAWLSNAK